MTREEELPGRNRPPVSFLGRLWVYGAAGAIVVALMGLLGYVPGLGVLGSVHEGYIPMAPSTAISFIVLGGVLLALRRAALPRAIPTVLAVLVALVSLFGGLEVAGYFSGRDLNFENALVPSAGYLGEIPVARMSPPTGALFLLAGLAAFALLLRVRTHGRGTRFGHFAGSLGSLVLGIGLLFCLAYLFGSPLLYGQGATVPMALTTALAFLMLGAAAVGASGEKAIPVSLLAGAQRASKPMSARKRFLFLALIMVGACAMVMVVMTVVLYRLEVREHREMLQVTAQSQARLIEAVARYDAKIAGKLRDEDPDHDASAATLSQIIDAHERFKGFGETGEFSLAQRDGDSIVFVLRHRYGAVERPAPVAFDSDLAEPMRRALKGLSGTIIGLDYRGKTVLAAHEPVAVLNLGIVAKIDLAELREPFIKSGFSAAAVALLVVLAGTALFFRVGNPIIERLEAYSRDLEKEVEERKRVEESLFESNTLLSKAERMASVGSWQWDIISNEFLFSEQWQRNHGVTKSRLSMDELMNIAYPDDTGAINKAFEDVSNGVKPKYDIEHRIIRQDNGEVRFVRAIGEVAERSELGEPLKMFGFAQDITEEKRTEGELEKHREHLEDLVRERTTQLDARVVEAEELNSAMVNVMDDLRSSNAELDAAGRELVASNQELDAFAYSVSHDLRAPLRHIAGFVNLLEKGSADALDTKGRRHLNVIAESAERMGHLIDDLLAFSRAGRIELHKDELDLGQLVEEVVRECAQATEGRDIAWEVAPLPKVQADRATMRQVLTNLVQNALKYSATREEARIEIGTVPGQEDEVVVFVRDNGVGFDMQYIDKLFGVFQRLHGTEEFEGTGIGLANVRRIIHRHGGRTWAEGKLDEGATFYFSLPREVEEG